MWTSRQGLSSLLLGLMLITQSFATAQANPANRVSEFKLANGLVLVVVPDTRAPVITHMVYFRVGSADEPPGVSGIAHFLEHLMFKSTEKLANGEFSAIVSRLGGQHNAFTSYDYTAYFERVAKERLKDVMEHGSRPHGEPAAGRGRGGDRAAGDHRGAPGAHRECAIQPPGRADVGGALSEPSLPHPHHRLDARDGQAFARGRACLLQALLCAQQRHRGRDRRCQSGRGEGAGRRDLRRSARQRRTSARVCGRRSPSSAPHDASS